MRFNFYLFILTFIASFLFLYYLLPDGLDINEVFRSNQVRHSTCSPCQSSISSDHHPYAHVKHPSRHSSDHGVPECQQHRPPAGNVNVITYMHDCKITDIISLEKPMTA
jgi:hypothetical protein